MYPFLESQGRYSKSYLLFDVEHWERQHKVVLSTFCIHARLSDHLDEFVKLDGGFPVWEFAKLRTRLHLTAGRIIVVVVKSGRGDVSRWGHDWGASCFNNRFALVAIRHVRCVPADSYKYINTLNHSFNSDLACLHLPGLFILLFRWFNEGWSVAL